MPITEMRSRRNCNPSNWRAEKMNDETSSGNDYLNSLLVWIIIMAITGVMMFTVCGVIDISRSAPQQQVRGLKK